MKMYPVIKAGVRHLTDRIRTNQLGRDCVKLVCVCVSVCYTTNTNWLALCLSIFLVLIQSDKNNTFWFEQIHIGIMVKR